MSKSSPVTIWPLVYLSLGLFGAFGPTSIKDSHRPSAIHLGGELVALLVLMPLLSSLAGFISYYSLRRRCTPTHLRAGLWNSAPSNPQSNQLAQIIFFGSFGLSAIAQWTDGYLRDFGFFGLWVAVALLVSLSVFRVRHVSPRRTTH